MAKLDGNKRLSRDAMPNSQDWIDPFLINQNQVNDSVVNAIRGNLNHQDNTTSGYFTGNFTHGVERIIRNPLIKSGTNGPSPIGVQAVNCQKLYTDSVNSLSPTVDAISLRYINGNDPNSAEQIGVTVQYSPPLGTLTLSRTTAQTITSATVTKISWENIEYTQGSSIATLGSPTKINFSVKGRVSVSGYALFNNTAGGTYRQMYVQKNGVDAPLVFSGSIIPQGSYAGMVTSSEMSVNSGDFIEMAVFQDSGLLINILGGNDRPYITARYVSVDAATVATVTLFFHGG